MNNSIEAKIKQIQDKLQELIRRNAAIEKENTALKQVLEETKIAAASATENMEAMQQQLDVIKYANTPMNAEEKKAFEKRINAYIREIDKCIALLSV